VFSGLDRSMLQVGSHLVWYEPAIKIDGRVEMKRDVLIEPFDEQTDLVIACDNSGSIGEKSGDMVSVSYETASYFAYRVAFMECVSAGGVPFAVTLQNFNGDQAWRSLVVGIQKGMKESYSRELRITGSTESNFHLDQSALGVTLLGKRVRKKQEAYPLNDDETKVAVIGSPLVGEAVITNQDQIAPLHLFQSFHWHRDVFAVVPVGSKGVAYELGRIFPNDSETIEADINVHASSGPATCFIAIYSK